MNRKILPLASCLLVLALGHPSSAQRVTPPEIVRVYVDTATGRAGIEWEASVSPDIEKYAVYYDSTILGQTSWRIVDTVDGGTRQFLYPGNRPDPSLAPQSLTVMAIDSAGEVGLQSTGHRTMHLQTFYDSCDKSMELSWTSYRGWETVIRYDVYSRTGSQPYQLLSTHEPGDTTSIHLEIEDNRSYCYFVKAIRDAFTSSFSNVACRHVLHPLYPDWIDAESASALEGDRIEVKFAIDPLSEVTSFQLFKSTGPGKPFVPDAVFTGVRDSLSHQDPVVSTEKTYQYKLYALDVCNQPDESSVSNVCRNVVLLAESEGLEGYLSWSPYGDYEAGLSSYLVYRSLNHSQLVQIATTLPSDTFFLDDLSLVSESQIEDEICYRVVAEENDSWTRGSKGYSRSNTACLSVVPEIRMATAFTPNGDGVNDVIAPVLTFLPRLYVFAVFDRWGNRIFETSDHEIPWDGRIKGGRLVPEGVYVYYILLTTSSGIEVEKTGEITVFYP